MPGHPRTAIAALVLTLAAGAAHGTCPSSPGDLTAGVLITFADGTTTVLTRDAEGFVVERTEFNDGSGGGAYYRSVRGLQFVELGTLQDGAIVDGATITRDYSLGLDWYREFGKPAAGETFVAEVTSTEPGYDPYTERHSFRTGEPETRTWGECSYEVLQVRVSYDIGETERFEYYDYIPTLDVAVFRGITEDIMAPPGVDPVSIGPAGVEG